MDAAYRIASLQAFSVVSCASLFLLLQGKNAAVAALFGGAASVVNTLFLAWCVRIGKQRTARDARKELSWLVRSSMERFFMVALLIVAGLGWLKLMPVPLLIGFVLGQLALVVSTIFSGIEK